MVQPVISHKKYAILLWKTAIFAKSVFWHLKTSQIRAKVELQKRLSVLNDFGLKSTKITHR